MGRYWLIAFFVSTALVSGSFMVGSVAVDRPGAGDRALEQTSSQISLITAREGAHLLVIADVGAR